MSDPTGLRVVPANEAPWPDLQRILGGPAGRCQCQRYLARDHWRDLTQDQRAERLREQTHCGEPGATSTSGLVAYLGPEPVGWVAVQSRAAYSSLRRTPWTGRTEDPDDPGVWAVTCFAVRADHRLRGLTYALASAAVDFARARGARALEGYPMQTEPGRVITWGELHVGSRDVFADAGFVEVSHPTLRRFVMRIDFALAPD